ncbi:MAG TPA: CU044_2847 family protein [Gemmatimonadaceae bacterium]|jgi:hypothetical protein
MDAIERTTIIVEFPRRAGVAEVSLTAGDVIAKSQLALAKTTEAIKEIALRVTAGLEDLVVRPQEIEVTFGLKFDAEAGVVVSKAGVEASVEVKLVWKEAKDPKDAT